MVGLPAPPTIWTLCFTPSFVLPQGTRYVRLQNLLLASTENKGQRRVFHSLPGKKILGAYSGPGTTGRNENVERRVPTRIFQPFLAYGHANCFNCKGNVTAPRRMGAFRKFWQKDLGHLALRPSCRSCFICETVSQISVSPKILRFKGLGRWHDEFSTAILFQI